MDSLLQWAIKECFGEINYHYLPLRHGKKHA
jgi:hypothetical protein